MFTHCLQIFSSRSLLWTKLREDDVRRLKAGEKNCRKENDCTAREQNWLYCRENRVWGRCRRGAGDESDKWREWPSANSCVLSQFHRRDCGNASGGKRSALCWLGSMPCHWNVGNNVYSTLRVIGDSLSDKFNFRLIMDESGVFPRGSMIGGS